MFKLLSLICVSLFAVSVYSATWLIPPEEAPAKYKDQDGCYLSSSDIMIPTGTPFFPKNGDKYECVKYLCDAKGFTHGFSCGKVLAVGNITLVEDFSKPYPDCCPKLQ